ncbi:type I-E CRISPR-associated protein Cas5/CasD [Thermus tengchongensis]|uniref:Type I-E CRISPR-associated protein Cas5/CasD n=2 Tax=Thermus tengchongensis TaxID=1214928 RepID=A0A4Y9FBI3_9DEIN|nr:type I-E CRISPR-associated protein Cas5/CasD [Thermus tengchongensis]TFU26517.1 type I-E CRISPR-associated protein Cas5/CasD [Thermus tengchongensis]
MATLLLRLQGPMQSWGTRSRFDHRDTWPYPTKSGVLGLLAAALGRDREEDISDLAALRMGVRVDQKGVLRVDYQTAQFVYKAEGYVAVNTQKEKEWLQEIIPHIPIRIDPKNSTVVSQRFYLSDAAFLVGLEGPKSLLEAAHRALKDPRYVLYLGRKGYVPSPPPYLEDGLREEPLEEALRAYPFLGKGKEGKDPRPEEGFLLVLEAEEGRLVYDQPVAPFAQRRFGARYVREEVLPKEAVPLPKEGDHVDQQAGA